MQISCPALPLQVPSLYWQKFPLDLETSVNLGRGKGSCQGGVRALRETLVGTLLFGPGNLWAQDSSSWTLGGGTEWVFTHLFIIYSTSLI